MKLLCLVITGLLLCSFVFSQTAAGESQAYNAAIKVYHQSLYPEISLYNGMEYVDYAYTIQNGTPFFDPVPFKSGSVIFGNILYENVPIAYDIVKDAVVIYDAPHLHKLILAGRKISSFTTSDHQFTHITKDSIAASGLNAGFYDILYDGKTRLLKKEKRTVQETISTSGVSKYITYSVDYFIKKDNAYHPVNNKKALFSLLKNKQKEVKQMLRKKKLKFSRDKDNALMQATAYYDVINQ